MRVKGLLGLLLTLALTVACQTATSGPSLLNLTAMSPKEIELGDELELSGSGFPEGKLARVVFRGDLYRAGAKVEEDREIVAKTTSLSPRSLTLAISDELRAAFTGRDDEARHTTFRGDIEVSFAPKKAGSAPVTGTLADVVLDVEPGLVSPLLQRQRDSQAEDALAFLGLTLRAPEEGDCCVVAQATGRAARAGVRAGDTLVDLDGVTVKSRWDLVPSNERRTSRLTFRGASGPVVVRELDVQGYHSAAPSELGPAMGLMGLVVLLLLVQGTRFGLPVHWLVHLLSRRLRERRATEGSRNRRTGQGWLPRSAWLALPEEPKYHLLAIGFLVGLWAVGLALAFRTELVSRELDLTLWCLLQTVSVGWAACLVMAKQPARPLRAAIRGMVSALLHQLPLLVLVAGCVVEAQTLRLLELVDAQDGGPLGWSAFRNPAWLVLTVISIGALVPTIEPVAEHRVPSVTRAPGRIRLLSFGLGRVLGATVHLWSSAILISLIALGGYRLPGLGATAQATSLTWQLTGAAWLLAKSGGLVLLVLVLRQIVGELTIEDSLQPALRYGLGVLTLTALIAAGWLWTGRTLALGWLKDVTAWVLLAATATVIGLAIYRAIRRSRLPRSLLGVNSWI